MYVCLSHIAKEGESVDTFGNDGGRPLDRDQKKVGYSGGVLTDL